MIALRLNKRRDGSLCVTDANGSSSSDDREFPAEHAFTYDRLVWMGAAASLEGDVLTLNLANGRAVYRITERKPDMVEVELEASSLFDAPPIDEVEAARIAEARTVDGAVEGGSIAHAGAAIIVDDAEEA